MKLQGLDPEKEYSNYDLYAHVEHVTCKEEVEEYLDNITNYIHLKYGVPKEEARKRHLENISYYAGYFDRDRCKEILELFETEHPVFGRHYDVPFHMLIEAGKSLAMGRPLREIRESIEKAMSTQE